MEGNEVVRSDWIQVWVVGDCDFPKLLSLFLGF